MKLLLCGCAAMALCVGMAGAASAQVEIKDSPIHAVPGDASPAGDAAPGPIAGPAAMTPEAGPSQGVAPAPAGDAPANVWVKPLSDQMGSAAPTAADAPTTAATGATPGGATPGGAALSQDEAFFFSSLGHRITDSASAYETFVRKAGAIDPAFHDGAGVRDALRTGADYQPRQFQEGVVAFAALLALRDQAFVDAVRAQNDPDFAERLTADPRSVLAIPGADRAAADVTAVLRAQGAALEERGAAITQAAYDVQAHAWSRQPVSDSAQALAAAKASAVEPRAASVESEKLLLHTVLTAPQGAQLSGDMANGAGVSPQVVRGLALAALAVRGRTGDREEVRFQSLMHDEMSAACLNMVKMNLDQCLAAAGPHYEHVFCVGRHAVGETAKCVSAAATGDGAPTGALLPRQLTASVEHYGPEAAASYGYAPSPRDDDDQPAAETRRPRDEAYGPDSRAAPPADYGRGYGRTYTPSYAQPGYAQPSYGQSGYAQPSYAQAYSPPPRAYAQDRYQQPTDDQHRYDDQDAYPAPDQDQRYAGARQPW